jgi:hypothetical protein
MDASATLQTGEHSTTWPSAVSGAIPHVGSPSWYFALLVAASLLAVVGWRWLELRAGRSGLMIAAMPPTPSSGSSGAKCGEHERRLGSLEEQGAQILRELHDKMLDQERSLREAMREEFAAARLETDRKIDSMRAEFQAMETRILEAVVRVTKSAK